MCAPYDEGVLEKWIFSVLIYWFSEYTNTKLHQHLIKFHIVNFGGLAMSLVNICLFFYVFWNCKTNTISDVNDTQRIEVILIPAYKLSYYKTNHFHPQPLYAINLFYIILWVYSLRRAPFTPLSINTQRPRNPIRSFDKQSGLILIAVPWQSPARPDLNEIPSRFGQIKCIPKPHQCCEI